MTPFEHHNCATCNFIGTFVDRYERRFDLYVCTPENRDVSYIVRFSSNSQDYLKVPSKVLDRLPNERKYVQVLKIARFIHTSGFFKPPKWIKWDGSQELPPELTEDSMVIVKFRYGSIDWSPTRADAQDWAHHDSFDDILEFAIVE